MSTVLVTGANRGLGLEFARQYAAEGWRVIATCRDPDGARDLGAVPGDVEVRPLDVNDAAAIRALADDISGETIDLLLLNAGAYGPRSVPLGSIDGAAWDATLHTNAVAPIMVAEAFIEHVVRSEGRKIAALSSKMGSIAENTSGASYIYRSSKAVLNAGMKSLALDVAGRGIACCVFHPGWVQTDMGGPNALIDTTTSVRGDARGYRFPVARNDRPVL